MSYITEKQMKTLGKYIKVLLGLGGLILLGVGIAIGLAVLS